MVRWMNRCKHSVIFCGSAGKQSVCNTGDLGSVPGLGKSPWRSKSLYSERLYSPVLWPGEFHGLYSPWGHKELDMTEQPSHITSKVFVCLFACLTSKAFKIISKFLNIAYIFLHYSALNSFSHPPPHPYSSTPVPR